MQLQNITITNAITNYTNKFELKTKKRYEQNYF